MLMLNGLVLLVAMSKQLLLAAVVLLAPQMVALAELVLLAIPQKQVKVAVEVADRILAQAEQAALVELMAALEVAVAAAQPQAELEEQAAPELCMCLALLQILMFKFSQMTAPGQSPQARLQLKLLLWAREEEGEEEEDMLLATLKTEAEVVAVVH